MSTPDPTTLPIPMSVLTERLHAWWRSRVQPESDEHRAACEALSELHPFDWTPELPESAFKHLQPRDGDLLVVKGIGDRAAQALVRWLSAAQGEAPRARVGVLTMPDTNPAEGSVTIKPLAEFAKDLDHTLVPDAKLASLSLDGTRLEFLRDHIVALWHEGRIGGGLELHEALAMTPGEYERWAMGPEGQTAMHWANSQMGEAVIRRALKSSPNVATVAALAALLDRAAELLADPSLETRTEEPAVAALARAVAQVQALLGTPELYATGADYVQRTEPFVHNSRCCVVPLSTRPIPDHYGTVRPRIDLVVQLPLGDVERLLRGGSVPLGFSIQARAPGESVLGPQAIPTEPEVPWAPPPHATSRLAHEHPDHQPLTWWSVYRWPERMDGFCAFIPAEGTRPIVGHAAFAPDDDIPF